MSKRQRMADQARVEAVLGLPEQGGPQLFQLPSGATFATAYQRIVYGDRGPYLELERAQITARLVSRYGNDLSTLPPASSELFYLWLHPETDPAVKVYWQIRTVAYADYRRGMFYVDPFALVAPGRTPILPAQAALFG